jgi:hypothetical protein
MRFRWAGPGEVASLAAFEAAPFLSGPLLFGFGGGFASDGACIHRVRVARQEMRTRSGVCTGPAPSSVICVAVAPGAGIVSWLQGRKVIAQRLFAHPAAVLPLRRGLPFFEGVRGVDVDNRFGERAW